MEKENSYIECNGKIGEVYPRIQVTFDTIVVFNGPEHEKIARKHIRTIKIRTDQIHEKEIIENAYDLFIEECKSSIKYGKYVEGADIKII